MMNPQARFRFTAIMSTALLVTATIMSVISDIKSLSDKVHFFPIIVAAVTLLGLVAAVLMWMNYREAIRLAETGVSQKTDGIAIEEPRADSQLLKKLKMQVAREGTSEVDIGGLALRSNFFKIGSEFNEVLLLALQKNRQLQVRIWLLDPRPPAVAIAMREMAERRRSDGMLQNTCLESLESLREIVLRIWKDQGRRRPTVVLVDKVAITHSIFRVDDEMVVCPYLQHGTGNASPTFHLRKGDQWFAMYKTQFDRCFEMHSMNVFPPDEDLTSSV